MSRAPRAQPALSWDGVWIVIPAYNEERTIRALAEAALTLCLRVLVVDDGSSDATADQLDGLPLTLLRHSCNQGKAASLRTAFRHALALGATCVVTFDGDGQHDPRDAPKLLAVWRRRPDRLVIGARLHDRSQFPPSRYFANRFACFWISWAAGHPVADSQSGFRVYPRAVMEIAVSDARGVEPIHVRERDHHRGGAARPSDAGRRDRGPLPARRAAEPLPLGRRHRQDRRDGRRPAAAQGAVSARPVAQPATRARGGAVCRVRARPESLRQVAAGTSYAGP